MTVAEQNAIPAGATNLFTVNKSIDGTVLTYGAGVQQIDNFAGGSLSALLADTAAWNGDFITLTGDNLIGLLGQTAQEFININSFGHICKCVSHVTGTTSLNGSASWIRTRSKDCLTIGVAQDDSIITSLTTEAGWNAVDNTKIITVRSRVGSWHRGLTGYFYACISEVTNSSWTWIRIGQPDAVPVDINDATLIAEIQANDFAVNPVLTPVATVKGSDMQRHYWLVNNTPKLAFCINKGTANWILMDGEEIKTKTVSVTSAQILNSFTTPVVMLPACPVGYMYNIVKVSARYIPVSIAYTTNLQMRIIMGTSVFVNFATLLIDSTDPAWDFPNIAALSIAGAGVTYESIPVRLTTATGNPAAGNGTLKVILTYNIVKV